MTTPSRWMAIALLLFAGAACGNGEEGSTPETPTSTTSTTSTPASTTSSTSTTTTTVPDPSPGLGISWTEPFEIRLPNGWLVRDCEGDRTNVCVVDGEDFVGDVELIAGYPLGEGEHGSAPEAVARQWAADFVDHFRDDRAQGCPTFTFVSDEVTDATVMGKPGSRSGFTLLTDDGTPVERVINYYAVFDDTMAIVNTDAYAEEGGCLGPSEYDPSLTLDDLGQLEPHLDALVAAATPPQPN